jgi:hypothetical protein
VTPTPPTPDEQPLPEAALGFPPPPPQFVPRDKSGNPIPDWRWEDMTMAQRRATYGNPADPEVQALIAVEEAAYRQDRLDG